MGYAPSPLRYTYDRADRLPVTYFTRRIILRNDPSQPGAPAFAATTVATTAIREYGESGVPTTRK